MRDTDAAVRRAIGYASGIVIPVIDVGPCFAGVPGARERTARQLGEALQTIGFFVLVGHDVPRDLIAQTFAEARRFHDLPMAAKLALRLNEHNNGYMAMGRYAVWTSDVNDERQARSERGLLHQARAHARTIRCVRSGRRFVGAECVARRDRTAGLPRRVLDVRRHDGCVRAPHAAGRRGGARPAARLVRRGLRREPVLVPAVALSAGRGRGQPVRHRAAHRQQLHDLPGADRGAGPAGAHAVGRLARRAVHPGLVRGELGRHDEALDQRPLQVDAAPGAAAGGAASLRHSVLPRAAIRLR